jgi:NAD(P)H-hydrate epimerase
MKKAEQNAERNGLSYARMMDNAGSAAARWIEKHFLLKPTDKVTVLCGSGNNGGDGFVVARRLAQKGLSVSVVLACGQPTSVTAKEMLSRLAPLSVLVVDGKNDSSFARQLLTERALIVDGIFGTGFHGELPAVPRNLLEYVSRLQKTVIALDLPSGVCADSGEVALGTPRCAATVSFHSYKYAHVLYPARAMCGRVHVSDIGIEQEIQSVPFVLDKKYIAPLLEREQGDTHKGTFGKAALVVGSEGMAGAAQFAVGACLRCGVGLAFPVVPTTIYPLVSSAAPEGVYRLYNSNGSPSQIPSLCMDSTALLLGCGLGNTPFTKSVCYELLQSYPAPLVLDADGINSLASHIDVLRTRKGHTVLTPHLGEMARLLKKDVAYVKANLLSVASRFASEYGVVLVLKSATTVIASPDGRVAVNITGNDGLSKGGSGDVLAGMIVSFCAQGLNPFDAACAGVWLHGRAGELTATKKSRRGMLPTDLVETLPSLFLEFEQ